VVEQVERGGRGDLRGHPGAPGVEGPEESRLHYRSGDGRDQQAGSPEKPVWLASPSRSVITHGPTAFVLPRIAQGNSSDAPGSSRTLTFRNNNYCYRAFRGTREER